MILLDEFGEAESFEQTTREDEFLEFLRIEGAVQFVQTQIKGADRVGLVGELPFQFPVKTIAGNGDIDSVIGKHHLVGSFKAVYDSKLRVQNRKPAEDGLKKTPVQVRDQIGLNIFLLQAHIMIRI